MSRVWTEAEWAEYKHRLLEALEDHEGEDNPCPGDVLYSLVFRRWPASRINGTRALRRLVRWLRSDGILIMSTSNPVNPGYYRPRPGTPEFERGCQELTDRALTGLSQVSKMRRIGLPAILGQLQLKYGAQAGTPAPPEGQEQGSGVRG